MDQFVLGNRRVNCEVIEADEEGYSPDNAAFNAKTTSLLDTIVETNNKVRTCVRGYAVCGALCLYLSIMFELISGHPEK